jgi:hypothetical protein
MWPKLAVGQELPAFFEQADVNGRTRVEVGGVGAVMAFFSSPEPRITTQFSVAHW